MGSFSVYQNVVYRHAHSVFLRLPFRCILDCRNLHVDENFHDSSLLVPASVVTALVSSPHHHVGVTSEYCGWTGMFSKLSYPVESNRPDCLYSSFTAFCRQ